MSPRDAYSILLRPLVTERSTQLRDRWNQYVFMVHPDSTKQDIRRAVETVFKVKVEQVRTLRLPGKLRRMGRFAGYRSDTKKAVVRLAPGQKIDLAIPTSG